MGSVVGTISSWRILPAGSIAFQRFPAQREHLEIYAASELETSLKPDSRFAGKIKWYVKPIAFGGDPDIETNLTWVDHEQHSQLVRWWNDLDNALKGRKA